MTRNRRGFTLLEVLLALSLGAMLMAGLFVALRVQGLLTEASTREIEQAQLARAVLDTIAADLRTAQPLPQSSETKSGVAESWETGVRAGDVWPRREVAPLTPEFTDLAGPESAGLVEDDEALRWVFERLSQPVPNDRYNFGIAGDPTHLAVTVHRPNPRVPSETSSAAGSTPLSSAVRPAEFGREWPFGETSLQRTPAPVHGKRTFIRVVYFLLGKLREESRANELGLSEQESELSKQQYAEPQLAGLVRLEIPQPPPDNLLESVQEVLEQLRRETLAQQTGAELSDFERPHLLPTGIRVELLAPEVEDLQFAFLDEWGWTWYWDTTDRLPRAVDVTIALPAAHEAREPTQVLRQPESVSIDPVEEPALVDDGLSRFRLTVRSPTGATDPRLANRFNPPSETVAPDEMPPFGPTFERRPLGPVFERTP